MDLVLEEEVEVEVVEMTLAVAVVVAVIAMTEAVVVVVVWDQVQDIAKDVVRREEAAPLEQTVSVLDQKAGKQ